MRKFPLCRLALAAAIVSVCLFATAKSTHAQTPFYAGAHLSAHGLSQPDQGNVGFGLRGGYEAYLPFISLEAELNFLPWSTGGSFGETQGLFGLKFGKKIGRWGAFFRVRPGFTHFGDGDFPDQLTESTKFALDLGGGIEYDIAPKVTLRLDLGDTRIYYGDAALRSSPGGPPGPRLGTHDTFQSNIGIVVHF
jgi:hypothetical protein